MKHIGKSYDKVDAKGILSGKPSYTGDFVPKDALIKMCIRDRCITNALYYIPFIYIGW